MDMNMEVDYNLGALVDSYWEDPAELARMLGSLSNFIMAGVDPGDQVDQMALLSALVTAREWKERWHGLNLKHIPAQLRLWVLSKLTFPGAKPYLTQEVLNFVTLADKPGRVLGLRTRVFELNPHAAYEATAQGIKLMNSSEIRNKIITAYSLDEREVKLAISFRDQLLEEARPFEKKVFTGTLVMDKIPLAHLDEHLDYDYLRLVIVPTGIFCTPVKDDGYCYNPFFWTAAGRTHIPFLNSAQVDLSLDVLMAGIWRDACVVQKRFIQDRVYKDPRPRSGKKSGTVILPRVIREVAWADERERTGITHAAHTVRPHYRELPPTWNTSERAAEKAGEFGWPTPPEGFTFIPPHIRGRGEAAIPDYRKVVCRGLLTVFTAIG